MKYDYGDYVRITAGLFKDLFAVVTYDFISPVGYAVWVLQGQRLRTGLTYIKEECLTKATVEEYEEAVAMHVLADL